MDQGKVVLYVSRAGETSPLAYASRLAFPDIELIDAGKFSDERPASRRLIIAYTSDDAVAAGLAERLARQGKLDLILRDIDAGPALPVGNVKISFMGRLRPEYARLPSIVTAIGWHMGSRFIRMTALKKKTQIEETRAAARAAQAEALARKIAASLLVEDSIPVHAYMATPPANKGALAEARL